MSESRLARVSFSRAYINAHKACRSSSECVISARAWVTPSNMDRSLTGHEGRLMVKNNLDSSSAVEMVSAQPGTTPVHASSPVCMFGLTLATTQPDSMAWATLHISIRGEISAAAYLQRAFGLTIPSTPPTTSRRIRRSRSPACRWRYCFLLSSALSASLRDCCGW